ERGKGKGFKYIRPALKIGHWAEVHTPYLNRIERQGRIITPQSTVNSQQSTVNTLMTNDQ
ncbi:hypothetical protein, partial [Nostoc linckia]